MLVELDWTQSFSQVSLAPAKVSWVAPLLLGCIIIVRYDFKRLYIGVLNKNLLHKGFDQIPRNEVKYDTQKYGNG